MNQNRIILVLFLGVLMGALDISIVGPAIPSIEQTIKISPEQISWIFTIYILFSLLGISLFAKLSDIHGRAKIYALSLFIFGFGSLVVAISQFYGLIIIGRAIQGFGASGIFPVASAVVGDIFPIEKRGRMLGLIGAVFGIAFILGPLFAGILLTWFSWNVLFLINIPVAMVLIYASLKILPKTRIARTVNIDWPGIVTLGTFLALLTLSINLINLTDITGSLFSLRFIILFILVLFFLAFHIYVEQRAVEPVLNLNYFRSRQVVTAGILAVGTGFFQAFFVFLPKLAVTAFNMSPSSASFMILPVVIATAIGSPGFGRMIDKTGTRVVVISGLMFIIAGMMIGTAGLHSKPYFYISGIFTGLAFSILSGPALRYILLNETSAQERASSQAVITIFISIGQIINATILGGMIGNTSRPVEGYYNAYVFLAILGIVLLLLSLRLKDKKEERRTG